MMNKLHAIIVVLFSLSAHQANWGMLTVADKTQLRSLEKYWTSEKISEKIGKPSQFFLKSFGEHSLRKTGLDFCNLRIDSKARVLPHLSYNQKLFVWFGAQGLDVCFLTTLCNGNERVAHMYRNESINEVLEAYAQAKERMKWSPIGNLQEQHYMMLKESHINSFVRAIKNRFVYQDNILNDDMRKIIIVLKTLIDIDPEIVGEIRNLTDLIKICPPLKDCAHIFYNCIPDKTCLEALISGASIFIGTGILADSIAFVIKNDLSSISNITYNMTKSLCKFIPGATIIIYVSLLHDNAFSSYQFHLKHNILPNQPTLTDYLKKHGFSEFANK